MTVHFRTRVTALVFLGCLALGVAYSWPLARVLTTRLPVDAGDPVFFTSILWWNATTTPFTAAWWNALHYFPSEGVAAFTESLAGISPIASPVYWTTHNPVAAHNVAYLLSAPLCAFAAYLLVRRLTGRHDAAILSALAYGFSPYRTAEIAHVQSLSAYYLPITLMALHAYLADRRQRWLWLFGASWLLQSLANGYYLLFGAVLIGLWVVYFCSAPRHWPAALRIVAAWTLASLPLVPMLLKYSAIHAQYGLVRNINEILAYSARPRSWFEVTGDVWFWRSRLLMGHDNLFPGLTVVAVVAAAMAAFWARAVVERGERLPRSILRGLLITIVAAALAFIGTTLARGPWSATIAGVVVRAADLERALIVLAIAATAIFWLTPSARRALRERSPFVFYVSAACIIAVLCLGPVVHAGPNDRVLIAAAPYSWLMALPGFRELRVVPRFWMFGVLCLAVATGLAFARYRPATPRAAGALFVVLSVALLGDGWMPGLRLATPPALWSTVEAAGNTAPILELPLGPDWDWDATYRAVSHRRRVFNGVSGYDPPHYIALRTGLGRRDPAMLAAVASLGAVDVVVNSAADPSGDIQRYVERAIGATRVASDGARTVYRLPQTPPAPPLGPAVPIARVEAFRHDDLFAKREPDATAAHDGNIATGWADYPQQPGQWVVVDLGAPREIAAVTQSLGEYFLDFPSRLAIELSEDGSAWRRVWEGDGAAPAFLGLVAEPRVGTLRFDFAPSVARYVRLLQLDTENRGWRVAELGVYAPTPASP